MRMGIILLVLLLVGCLDLIHVDLPEANLRPKVVEGYVERDSNHYFLWGKVSRAQSITGEYQAETIDAQVNIVFNDDNQIPVNEDSVLKISIDDFHDIYGGEPSEAKFRLKAIAEDQTYISPILTIKEVPSPDSLSITTLTRHVINQSGNIVNQQFVKLHVHTPLINRNNELTSLFWSVTSAYRFTEGQRDDPLHVPKVCYVSYSSHQNEVKIVSPQDYPGAQYVGPIEVAEEAVDHKYGQHLYHTVVQKSIGDKAYEYWQEVKSSNERSGNIYDVFPGKIRTNIINEADSDEIVYGFFQVSEVDTIRIRIMPGQVGFPKSQCAFWMEPELIVPDDPDPCFDCLNLHTSTLMPPHYWK